MNAAGIAGLIRRRGLIVEWHHAIPASGDRVDPISLEPILTAGGARKALGPSGETYHDPVRVRAYWSKKVSAIFAKQYGILDERDSQLDIAARFVPEPALGIEITDPELRAAYEAGNFCDLTRPDDFDSHELIARDKFVINGVTWIVKSAAVPIVDANRTVAWRLLIGAQTY